MLLVPLSWHSFHCPLYFIANGTSVFLSHILANGWLMPNGRPSMSMWFVEGTPTPTLSWLYNLYMPKSTSSSLWHHHFVRWRWHNIRNHRHQKKQKRYKMLNWCFITVSRHLSLSYIHTQHDECVLVRFLDYRYFNKSNYRDIRNEIANRIRSNVVHNRLKA